MPTIETFGMPTRTINSLCPTCGVGDLVMKFDMANGHMNRISCPVQACPYDVSVKEFQSALTEVLPYNCSVCGQAMLRTTKDVESQFMGWAKCSNAVCTNALPFTEFKATRPVRNS